MILHDFVFNTEFFVSFIQYNLISEYVSLISAWLSILIDCLDNEGNHEILPLIWCGHLTLIEILAINDSQCSNFICSAIYNTKKVPSPFIVFGYLACFLTERLMHLITFIVDITNELYSMYSTAW